jgi:hypothetical protein
MYLIGATQQRQIEPLTPCMPCSFGPLRFPWSEAVRPAHRAPPCDRECPLVTAGARSLWHAGGTCRRRLPARGSVWLTAGGEGLVGKLRSGAAASGRLGSRSVEPPAQLPSVGLTQRRPLVPITGSAGETSPPSARLSSAVQQALIQHFVPYARDAPL